MDTIWTAVSALSTMGTMIIILFSAIILIWQLREMRKATYAQAWIFIMNHLQEEEVRTDRGRLFELHKKGFDNLSEDEKEQWKILAERACHRYDCIGVMSKYKMFPVKIIKKTYKNSIKNSWEATQSLVEKYQADRGREFWGHFKWLFNKVK
ncbi:MAG: DUF4760 domain-containing protein [Candidatus Hodarchaeales archaeon]|jgi:cbb3-type cytochrome oxidase subunit 3